MPTSWNKGILITQLPCYQSICSGSLPATTKPCPYWTGNMGSWVTNIPLSEVLVYPRGSVQYMNPPHPSWLQYFMAHLVPPQKFPLIHKLSLNQVLSSALALVQIIWERSIHFIFCSSSFLLFILFLNQIGL